MLKRGRILRDPSAGVGLISSGGKQYEFTLEAAWDCDTPPVTGMVVDLEVNENDELIAAWVVNEKALATDEAALVFEAAKQRILKAYVATANLVGKPVLAATVALIIGWFLMNSIVIEAAGQQNGVTFWQVLGIVNSNGNLQAAIIGGSKGIYGFLCIAAILGPFIFIFWKNPLAHFGNCLAIVLILFVVISTYMNFLDQVNTAKEGMVNLGKSFGGIVDQKQIDEIGNKYLDKAIDEAMEAMHIGWGAYLSLIASLYLAMVGVKNFLVASAANRYAVSTAASNSPSRTSGRRSANKSQTGNESAGRIKTMAEPPAERLNTLTCPACNAPREESDKFCGECGAKLN